MVKIKDKNFATIHQNNYFKCLYISDHLDPCSQHGIDKTVSYTKLFDNQYVTQTYSSGLRNEKRSQQRLN